MSLTTLEPTTIEDLDFEPACEMEYCWASHPPATHIVTCHPPCGCNNSRLSCSGCVQRFVGDRGIAHECIYCDAPYFGLLRDILDIRPLS